MVRSSRMLLLVWNPVQDQPCATWPRMLAMCLLVAWRPLSLIPSSTSWKLSLDPRIAVASSQWRRLIKPQERNRRALINQTMQPWVRPQQRRLMNSMSPFKRNRVVPILRMNHRHRLVKRGTYLGALTLLPVRRRMLKVTKLVYRRKGPLQLKRRKATSRTIKLANRRKRRLQPKRKRRMTMEIPRTINLLRLRRSTRRICLPASRRLKQLWRREHPMATAMMIPLLAVNPAPLIRALRLPPNLLAPMTMRGLCCRRKSRFLLKRERTKERRLSRRLMISLPRKIARTGRLLVTRQVSL
mmetsp:Transcript_24426/g.52915  ORF Transcript_24426/g.52915 Transcript_24426/m.52915 type:complete len:299 (-) Transcript_24426:1288-2184(-)